MLRITFRMLTLFLLITFVLGLGIGHFTCDDNNSKKIDERDATIADLQGQIETLRTDLAKWETDHQALQADYDTLSEDFSDLQTTYQELLKNATAQRVSELLANIRQLTDDNLDLDSRLTTAETDYDLLDQRFEAVTDANSTLATKLSDAEIEIIQLKWRVSELNDDIADLEDKLTISPDNALDPKNVFGFYKSAAWLGDDPFKLQQTAREIGIRYWENESHEYIEGIYDCNDMAADLWNMLYAKDIKSVIVIGSLDTLEEDTLEESDHAWLFIFDAEGRVFYMEPTTGEVLFGESGNFSASYKYGILYATPADLKKDLKYLLF